MQFLPAVALRRRFAASVAAVLAVALLPVLSQAPSAVASNDEPSSAAGSNGGYWLVGSDGGVFAYGDARFLGSTGNIKLNQPIVGMAPTPSGNGYWMVASDGGIFAFGDAAFQGSTGNIKLNRPIVGMAATPSGKGYWLVASDGGIFAFGDAAFQGSTGNIKLNKPIEGMASTPSGKGYWLVASDGGIFAFGDAPFFGSTGNIKLNQPITGIAATPTGQGYWMTATDGGVFAFGDAVFKGAAPSIPSRAPRRIVAMVPTATGQGYWQAGASGELLAFGDASKLGAPSSVNKEIVGMAALGRSPGAPNGLRDGVVTTTTTTTVPMNVSPPPYTGNLPQFFSSTANPTWGTSPSEDPQEAGRDKAGKVMAIAEVGDKVFVGGEFAGVMPAGISTGAARKDPSSVVRRPFLVALDVNTGALLDWDAHPDGFVHSLAVSPDGTKLYVGGRFRHLGGQLSLHLGAVSVTTGALDPTFKPPTPDKGVKALALSGGTLYVGGDFLAMGTAPYPQVAAVDATTGALRTGFVPPANTGGRYIGHQGTPTEDGNDGLIYDMAVTADGSTLFVGGDFLHFGGQSGLLVLDATTGAPTAWQPVMTRPVYGLTIWPGDGKTVFAATGGAGGTVQAFLPGGKSKNPLWVGHVDGDGTDVAATTERVYLVGHYDHEVPNKNDPCLTAVPAFCPNGTPHRKLAVFEARTGNLDPSFNGQANTPQGPYVALIGAHHLYVGGDFTEAGPEGQLTPHPGFIQFNATG